MDVEMRRPLAATLWAGGLIVSAAMVAAGTIVIVWMGSGMEASRDSGTGLPLALGLLVALTLATAAGLLLRGGQRLGVIGLAAVAPAGCVFASGSSSDLANLLPVAVVAWLGLVCALLRGRSLRAWTAARP